MSIIKVCEAHQLVSNCSILGFGHNYTGVLRKKFPEIQGGNSVINKKIIIINNPHRNIN